MGFHVTSGRMATKQPHALSAGASVSATLVETTGPYNQVTGARSVPTRSPDVLESRFAPFGTFTTPVKNRLCRWAMAQAGHSVNHTCCAGSPQPHVRLEAGWPDHTCHHSTTAGTANPAMTARWKPTPRSTRASPRRGAGLCGSQPSASGASSESGGPSPSSARSASSGAPSIPCAGCVDTSDPLVTAGERTAGPSTALRTRGSQRRSRSARPS